MALRRFGKALGEAAIGVKVALLSAIGVEEALIYTALALLACGCWQVWKPGAYLVPGAIMLWMYLPTRAPLIHREPKALVVRRRKE